MSRKHYRAIAEALKNTAEEGWASDRAAVGKVALALCPVLKSDNPRFSADTFLTAAGFPELAREGY